MKIVRNLNSIWDSLNEYKNKIDVFCGQATVDQKNFSDEVQKLKASGNYTTKYIADYAIRNNPTSKFREPMERLRAEYARKVIPVIEDIKEEMDSFFRGPVSAEFSAKVTAATAAGMRFSDEDFELMCEQARSYMELKIINTLAESRTREEVRYSKKDGEPQKVVVKDPYLLKNTLPLPKEAEDVFNRFKDNAEFFLNKYCGTGLELYATLDAPDDIGSMGMISNADAILRSNGNFEKMDKLMESVKKVAPAWAAEVPSISKHEKERLDEALDPSKAEKRTRREMQEFAKKYPYLGELAARDSRYMKHFTPEPRYIM